MIFSRNHWNHGCQKRQGVKSLPDAVIKGAKTLGIVWRWCTKQKEALSKLHHGSILLDERQRIEMMGIRNPQGKGVGTVLVIGGSGNGRSWQNEGPESYMKISTERKDVQKNGI